MADSKDPPGGPPGGTPDGDELASLEAEQARERSGLRPHVVHEVIRREGELELLRPASALAWSGLAAGLSMGLCALAQALLHAVLPDGPWREPLVRLGYPVGFIATILSRQQLFTENTLIAVLPLLSERSRGALRRVARLWAIVLAGNLVGCLVFAALLSLGGVLDGRSETALSAVAAVAVGGRPLPTLVRAIGSGWLIALMVWMLPAAGSSRMMVIALMTYVVALAGFPHIVASSVEALWSLLHGALTPGDCATFLALTLSGNVIGGVCLVAVVNHAQVVAGSATEAAS